MEGGHKGYPVTGVLVVSFLLENIRSGERTNFVNGLLNHPSTMPSSDKVIFQVPSMG